jgi:hypothetical protein
MRILSAVENNTNHGHRAQAQSRVARQSVPLIERLDYSPAEFAALFGRSPTWDYRQIYAGRVRPVADCGRLIIPRAEVESVLARRREYNPAQAAITPPQAVQVLPHSRRTAKGKCNESHSYG